MRYGIWALAALVIGAKRSRSRRRFAQAASNRERVAAVWTDTVESLRPLGLSRTSTETIPEFARRAGVEAAPTRADLERLGNLAVQASYAPGDPSDTDVENAKTHRDNVAGAVHAMTSSSDRIKNSLDPRPLVSRR